MARSCWRSSDQRCWTNAVPGADVDLRGTLWYYWWLKDALLTGGSTGHRPLLPIRRRHPCTNGRKRRRRALDPIPWAFGTPLRRVCCSAICRKHCGDASLLKTIGVSLAACSVRFGW